MVSNEKRMSSWSSSSGLPADSITHCYMNLTKPLKFPKHVNKYLNLLSSSTVINEQQTQSTRVDKERDAGMITDSQPGKLRPVQITNHSNIFEMF